MKVLQNIGEKINQPKITNNKNLIIIVLILLLGVSLYFAFSYKKNVDDAWSQKLKLQEALGDSVRYYETEMGEVIAEKRTLQGDIDDLLNDVSGLNSDKVELLQTIERINKERKKDREIFAAARIEYAALIDSINTLLVRATSVDTVNNVVSFAETDTAAHFIYDLDVMGVRPFPITINPELKFNKIDFPNVQTITFQWDKNKRKDYPVSFSVMNTNKYYRVQNIESYAIPGLQKDVVDPSGFKKVWRWIKINGKYILVGVAGYAIGSAIN